MAYFDLFPSTYYTFDNVNATLITNFMARVAVSTELKNNVQMFDPYTIIDGDTPEIVADQIYGDTGLHWIILLTNDMIDPRYDWCLSQDHLLSMCQSKYSDIYGIHHWQDSKGFIVDQTYPGAASVSNYDYEDRINESKRVIKILNQNLVQEFIKEFSTAMGN